MKSLASELDLRITDLVASRHLKREKGSLPVGIRQSKRGYLNSLIWFL